MHYKPDGYQSVSPYLIVKGAAATIEFLKVVFDAAEIRRFSDDAGGVRHAEVRIDDTVVMIADGVEGWPPLSSHVHVYTRDVDATYRRALEAGGVSVQEPVKKEDEDKRGGVMDAGGVSVQEPVKKEDEDKRGGVMDAGGTTWWIATKVA